MKIKLEHRGQEFQCDLSQPIDLSIPVGQVRCFYSTPFEAKPYQSGDFVGSVNDGAPVNFYDVQMNPHGNGTHTECLGHITKKQEKVSEEMKTFHFLAQVVSLPLAKLDNGDKVLSLENLKTACLENLPPAIILRSLPNLSDKLTMDYSGTNPPYLDSAAMQYLVDGGVRHLLIDLPSVDREEDDGILASHHVFWNVGDAEAKDDSRKDCTITEMIFVPDEITDGLYLLNLQVPNLPLDAAPSKPVIYKLERHD